MAISDLLTKLIELKNQLVSNLNSMGVAADQSEKLNTLVPKVLECETEQNVEFVSSPTFNGSYYKNGSDFTVYYVGLARAIKTIRIPDGTTKIGNVAFYGCDYLESIIISDGVKSIGEYAFYKCGRLESITIPDSVTSISDFAFAYCSNLAHIYYKGTEEQWNSIQKTNYFDGNTTTSKIGYNVSGGTTIHYNYVPE